MNQQQRELAGRIIGSIKGTEGKGREDVAASSEGGRSSMGMGSRLLTKGLFGGASTERNAKGGHQNMNNSCSRSHKRTGGR